MTVRGAGVGIELSETVVRGVRVGDPGDSGTDRVVAVGEAPISRRDDEGAVLDALVRVHAQLDGADATTRIAWFPATTTMQRIDVTGLAGPELNRLRHHLADEHLIDSTMLVELGARRWMLALRWDHRNATRLEFLAERAGFVDPAVEPAPVALGRCLATGTPVVRRDAAADQSWAAVFDTGTPIAAATVPAGDREFPAIAAASTVLGVHRLEQVLGADAIGDLVDDLTSTALVDAPVGRLRLLIVGAEYPDYPAHDLRAAGRVAVSLGAALGAAGLAGPSRPVDVLAPTAVADERTPRPWAIERISDEPLLRTPSRRRHRRWALRPRR